MISYICKNLYVGGNYFMREKILSMILALSMLCAFVPMTASAETYEKIHWRQIILFCEIVFLLVVGFLPAYFEPLANAMVSFVCAMQVQAFHKVRGHAYASTMCIGNMRSGTEALCAYFRTRDKEILQKSLTYFGVIFVFGIGAGLGSLMSGLLGTKAIWCCCVSLLVSFVMMFVPEKNG